MERINKFSDSTLSYIGEKYYVYVLSDKEGNIFYVGKGKGNRVFSHEMESELIDENILSEKHRVILASKGEVERRIVSLNLTEEEAFASEHTLIEYLGLAKLTNRVKGHGLRGGIVEEIEKVYGYEKITTSEINSDKLILAVKIKDAFTLDLDESLDYSWVEDHFDNSNLKSRTLGFWKISKTKAGNIAYVIGINSSAHNSVVSAYKVSGYETDGNRFAFKTNTESKSVLIKLGLYKKALADLKFGSGSAIAYINK